MLKPNENLFRRTAAGIARGFRAGRRAAGCGTGTAHGGTYSALLFRRELQDVVDQQFCLILVIAFERWRSRTGENPVAVFALEETGWHGGARTDGLRVDDPAFHPVWLQAAAGLEEVRSGGEAIVSRVAGGVTFQAGRGGASEEGARHFGFLGGKDGNLLRDVRVGLARQSLEETHQFAEVGFGGRECGHAHLEGGAHAAAIVVV